MSNLRDFSLEELDELDKNYIYLSKETALELLSILEHQFINYKFTKVHELIKQLQEFTK